MKAVILAGGFGTRLSEETHLKPKPMIEIGGRPILWHILKIYAASGITDFIVCCGYKGYAIKEYFANYYLHQSDVTFDLQNNSMEVHQSAVEPWKVTLVDTGESTMTGGRLLRVKKYLEKETFCFTYGDGVTDANIQNVISFHKQHGGIATLTAVQPPGRFGALDVNQDNVIQSFNEKPAGDGSWVNAGFFVLEPGVFDYIEGDDTVFERKPLQSLAKEKQLHSFKHQGFWMPMDTLRDKNMMDELWNSGKAPWKKWEN